jgi:glycerol uptake facilitator-like aquaporin
LTLIAGWSADITFGDATDSFFWIPWLLPHIGGVFGAIVYAGIVSMHHS